MLKALASAGADVVMHGLVTQDELDQKTTALKEEYGVKVGHSAANVRKPQENQVSNAAFAILLAACLWHAHFDHSAPWPHHSPHCMPAGI